MSTHNSLATYFVSQAVLLALPSVTVAQCAYEFTAIYPIPQTGGVAGWGIGDDGSVVGSATWLPTLKDRPMRWSAQTGVVLLPMPAGGIQGRAQRMAPDGTLVGWFTPAGHPDDRRFIVWFNGTVEGSSALAQMTSISVYGAGPQGLAVGMMQSGVEPPYPVMWQDGAYLDLPDEVVAGHGLIAGPNRFGVFTGYRYPSGEQAKDGRPFLWTPGGAIGTLPIPLGMLAAEGDAINAAAHVGGRAYLPPIDQSALGPWRPYFWNGQTAIELPMLPGATKATVFDINDVDQLVGYCTLPRNPSGATIWINELPYSLHELASLPTSSQVTIASGINESGQVVANGSFNAAGTGVFTPVGVVPADVTLDCKVNERDIEKVIQSWGPVDSAVVRRADIDGNGVIDGFDLAEVLAAWTG